MLFLTGWFVCFAAVVYPLYWLVPNRQFRLHFLLTVSFTFHTAFAGPAGVLPIVALGVATFLAGLSRQRTVCWAAAGLSVAALVFYKYTTFLCVAVVGSLAPSLGSWLDHHSRAVLPSAPPLAISFFAFEFIHYLVDVSRGSPPIRSVKKFALFAVFWPSIVAGPVKRYREFLHTLQAGIAGVSQRDAAVGLARVAMGLVKKFGADTLTAWIAVTDDAFAHTCIEKRWLLVVALGMRILLDFSGYSDMAIGFARMHGIRLPENFNHPYAARSLTDFWRRWHMSLSSWIRDYVYIPLGGGRCGPVRKVCNALLAFGLCGLWHGAGWNFIVWGLYHGVGLAAVSAFGPMYDRRTARLPRWLAGGFAWAATMLFVFVGWVFFFYPLTDAWRMIVLLFVRR